MLSSIPEMTDPAFYIRTGPTSFTPTSATAGPWDSRLQHGGPVAALLLTAIQAAAPHPQRRIAHFALEFLGPVPLLPMQVTAEVLRPGKKIELCAASALIGERPVLRATAWQVATGPGRSPTINLAEPPPPRSATATIDLFPSLPRFGYGEALEWRFTSGSFSSLGPATVWTRLRTTLIAGEPVSPLVHAFLMVDSANGISAELDPGQFLFVPVNLTVSIARMPEGEWLGMSARTELASEGVGTAHARLFDERGYFGQAMQTLFVEPRAQPPGLG